MQIYGAYTRGIDGHLFTVSAAPNRAGRLRVAGVRDSVAQQTATTVSHALKRLGLCNVGADVRLDPAGAGDPPLATGRYSGTLELPIALALLGMTGRLPADRITGIVAVGGLDPFAANERAGVRCTSAGGTTAIAHAAETRGLRLFVAEDQTAAAGVECRETDRRRDARRARGRARRRQGRRPGRRPAPASNGRREATRPGSVAHQRGRPARARDLVRGVAQHPRHRP